MGHGVPGAPWQIVLKSYVFLSSSKVKLAGRNMRELSNKQFKSLALSIPFKDEHDKVPSQVIHILKLYTHMLQ